MRIIFIFAALLLLAQNCGSAAAKNSSVASPVVALPVATIDHQAPDTSKPDKAKPSPNPEVNPMALFGDVNKSKQGNPQGTLGDGGYGVGYGEGSFAKRSIREKCTMGTHSGEVGTAWVYICVDESGNVTEANFQKITKRGDVSTISSPEQIRLAEKCAKEYKYERAAGMGKSCGSIPIVFKRQ